VADLTIDAHGRVTDCRIVEAAAASLREQTCHLAVSSRGLFRAARDRQGNAVVGHYRLRIRWQLPDGDPTPPRPARSSAAISEMIVEPDGRATDCRGRTLPGNIAIPDLPCPSSTEGLRAAVMRHAGLGAPPRFRYFALVEHVFGDGPPASDDMAKDMAILQRLRVDFRIDATGRAVDCRWSVRMGVVDGQPMPTRCQTGEASPTCPSLAMIRWRSFTRSCRPARDGPHGAAMISVAAMQRMDAPRVSA